MKFIKSRKLEKKLVIVVVISGILMTNILIGCGKKEVPVESQNMSVETTEEVDESLIGGDETKAEVMDDYSLWTAKEWNSASDEEKKECFKILSGRKHKSYSTGCRTGLFKKMEPTITEEAINANIMALEAAFAAAGSMNLKDLLDMTTNAANVMIESAMQQTP